MVPGQDDDEEEASDGEKVQKPMASRVALACATSLLRKDRGPGLHMLRLRQGKPLKAASADDLAHVRASRKDTAEVTLALPFRQPIVFRV